MIPILAAGRPPADQIRRWAAEAVEGLRPDPVQSLWQQLLERVARWWDTVVFPVGGLSGSGAAAALVAIALTVIALLLVRGIRARRTRGTVPAASSFEPETAVPDPDTARAAATSLAAARRYRDAVRARYRAMLIELDRRGTLPFSPARTNWEAVAALRSAPIGAPLREATMLFERVWYGMADAGPETYVRTDRLCAAVEGTRTAA
jgi:hypothetical protein